MNHNEKISPICRFTIFLLLSSEYSEYSVAEWLSIALFHSLVLCTFLVALIKTLVSPENLLRYTYEVRGARVAQKPSNIINIHHVDI